MKPKNNPSARTQTVFFVLWKEASWRRHLEGGIWEASGRLSEALWELSGELSGSWGGHGGFKGILDRKCSKFIVFYSKNEKDKYNFA